MGRTPRLFCVGGGEFPVLYRVSAGHDQLVLPAAGGFRELVLAELHDSQLGGHLDSRHTLAVLYFASGGLVCVLTWLLTWQAAPRVSG